MYVTCWCAKTAWLFTSSLRLSPFKSLSSNRKEKIPTKRCQSCYEHGYCEDKPALCIEPCFRLYHDLQIRAPDGVEDESFTVVKNVIIWNQTYAFSVYTPLTENDLLKYWNFEALYILAPMFPESKALQKVKVYKLVLLFPSNFSWKHKSFDEF